MPPSHALNVVNGNIVALCGIDMNNNEWQEGESIAGPRILNRSPLCACYGFGKHINVHIFFSFPIYLIIRS